MKPTTAFLTWCVCLSITLLTTLPAASVRADSCPPAWTPGFGVPGTNGDVRVLTMFDDGTGPARYAGGQCTAAGGAAPIWALSSIEAALCPRAQGTAVRPKVVTKKGICE